MIELWRQVIVLSGCFRLVRFGGVDRCTGNRSAVFHLAHHSPRRIERPKAIGSSFRESLRTTNEAESFLRQSSRRARARLTRNTLKATRVFSRTTARHHREQLLHDGWGDHENPYFPGLNLISTCSENNRIPTSCAAVVPHWPTSASREFDCRCDQIRRNGSANRREKNPETCVANIRVASVTRT